MPDDQPSDVEQLLTQLRRQINAITADQVVKSECFFDTDDGSRAMRLTLTDGTMLGLVQARCTHTIMLNGLCIANTMSKEDRNLIIRRFYGSGRFSQAQLAVKFNLSQAAICKILKRFID